VFFSGCCLLAQAQSQPAPCFVSAAADVAQQGRRALPQASPATVEVAAQATRVVLYTGSAADGAAPGPAGISIAAADSGEILWYATPATGADATGHRVEHRALGAAITAGAAVLTDSRGIAYRAYVGDTAGNVWRIDLPASGPGDWSLRRVAALRDPQTGHAPVFAFAPDVVRTVDGRGRPFHGLVLAGAGAAGDAAPRHLFYLRDYAQPDAGGAPSLPIGWGDLTDADACAGRSVCNSSAAGWRLPLSRPGEVAAGRALVEGGRVFLSTWLPDAAECDRERGTAAVYTVRLADGAPLDSAPVRHFPDAGMPGEPFLSEGRITLLADGDAAGDAFPEDAWSAPAVGAALSSLYWRDLFLDSD
jgi:type IV pilus assembly protein PilY1